MVVMQFILTRYGYEQERYVKQSLTLSVISLPTTLNAHAKNKNECEERVTGKALEARAGGDEGVKLWQTFFDLFSEPMGEFEKV